MWSCCTGVRWAAAWSVTSAPSLRSESSASARRSGVMAMAGLGALGAAAGADARPSFSFSHYLGAGAGVARVVGPHRNRLRGRP